MQSRLAKAAGRVGRENPSGTGAVLEGGNRLQEALAKLPEEMQGMDLNLLALPFLRALPEPMGDVVLEICERQGLQPSHLILGHLLRADQRSELNAPMLLPEWTSDSDVPKAQVGKRCEACQRRMQGKRADSRFCCNACGSGKYADTQAHSPDCEFYHAPIKVLNTDKFNPNLPPEDPVERQKWEDRMLEIRMQESAAAENTAGGLPPADVDPNARIGWN